MRNALWHRAGACAQRLVSRNALCRRGGPVHNALSRRGCPCVGACGCVLAVRATDFLPVSHGLKSQGGALCTTPCVTGGASAQRLVSPRRGLCATPCVTLKGPCAQRLVSPREGLVRNALWHREACAQRLVSRNALCHRGGARAQRLVSPARACAQRLVSPKGGLCATPCVTGGAGAQPCVTGGLCTTPCVTERVLVPNALCRATPCVAEGGPVHNALSRRGCPCVGACGCVLAVRATDFLPVSHGLKSQGGPCAQRLVSRGGPVRNALCHREGACAQRLVSP